MSGCLPPCRIGAVLNPAPTVRSNQRDLFQVASLREDVENVFRSWLGKFLVYVQLSVAECAVGTRWLTRWDKEVDFAANVLYYGLTLGLGALLVQWCCLSKLNCLPQALKLWGKNTLIFGSTLRAHDGNLTLVSEPHSFSFRHFPPTYCQDSALRSRRHL